MYKSDNRLILVFFFSSRRRHTRYWRDWSSDVCSSDLGVDDEDVRGVLRAEAFEHRGEDVGPPLAEHQLRQDVVDLHHPLIRSEERRVGKECRSRWSPYH